MRIGIYGSAFDPITYAHIGVAKKAARENGLDKVIFVPSSERRVDKGRKLTSNNHRWKMLQLAVQDETLFDVSPAEMIAPVDQQFTFYTMENFKKEYPEAELFFIMGSDNLKDISRWKRYEELVRDNKFIVVARQGFDMEEIISGNPVLSKYKENFKLTDEVFFSSMSSTYIREEIKKGETVNYLIPPRTYRYIKKNNLYVTEKEGEMSYMSTMQARIIERLKVNSRINAKVEIKKRIDFLKGYMKKNPFVESLILGISGGQDSTLAGKLCQMAVNELNEEIGEEKYKFIAVRLPYGVQKDEEDCQRALEFIAADKVFTVNVKPAVDMSIQTIEQATGEKVSDFFKGNEKARERMKAQYTIAAMNNGLVVGTDHAAEAIMGFFTKYGDGACDIVPLYGLNKRQGKLMLRELGGPEEICVKDPTADLEDNKPQLPDEVALGVVYDEIDDYTEGKQINPKSAKIIEDTFTKTEHKRFGPVSMFDELGR